MDSTGSANNNKTRREKNRLAQQRHRTRARELRANQQQGAEREEAMTMAPPTVNGHITNTQAGFDPIEFEPMNVEPINLDQIPHDNWNMAETYPTFGHNQDLQMTTFPNDRTQAPGSLAPNGTASAPSFSDISNPVVEYGGPGAAQRSRVTFPEQSIRNISGENLVGHGSLDSLGTRNSGGSDHRSQHNDSWAHFNQPRYRQDQNPSHERRPATATRRLTEHQRIQGNPTALRDTQAPNTVPEKQPLKPVSRPYCALVDGAIPAGRTPLHMLCERGNEAMILRLISTGANAEAEDEYGMTPLHIAARRGNNGAVTALLDRGIPIDTRDKQGWTPLHHASWCGYDETVTLLVRRGASPDAATIPDEE